MTDTSPDRPPQTKIPRGDAKAGHLRIERGIQRAQIKTEPGLGDLLHGRWARAPQISAEDGVVTLRYPRIRLARWGTDQITLDPTVPWDITIDGGVQRVAADLRGMRLRSLTIKGAATRLWLILGPPDQDVEINLRSADRLTVRRPKETEVRLHISHGATEVVVDDQTYGAIGGETTITTGPVVWNSYYVNLSGARRVRVAPL